MIIYLILLVTSDGPYRRVQAKEVVDLLTAAADGGKSLIDASDRLILYIEIARLFGTIGYHRKAAFFSRQVAQLYMQQENRLAAISAMQVLAMTTKAYRVQSRASIMKIRPQSVSILELVCLGMFVTKAIFLFYLGWEKVEYLVFLLCAVTYSVYILQKGIKCITTEKQVSFKLLKRSFCFICSSLVENLVKF